jgi:hypothetical protein
MVPTGRPSRLARGAVHHAARTAAGAALLLVVGSAVAENGWRSTLGVNSALNFTDNVFLSQVDPESDVVLEFQPYFNSTWQGRISSAQVAYGPQFVAYANNVELDRTWQYLRATGTTEVVEDFFSLTAWAQANPTVIDQGTGSAGFDTVGNPDAYTQTASFAIVPTFTFPLVPASIWPCPGTPPVIPKPPRPSAPRRPSRLQAGRISIACPGA